MTPDIPKVPNKHLNKGSIAARIVKMPKMDGFRDWRELNPQLKGFKDAKMPPKEMKS